MTASAFDIAGRAVLVTGASSGLGEHFARVLAGAGARVAIAARRTDRIEALASEIGGGAAAVEMDVTDEASVAAGVAEAETALGPLGIVINNAGVTVTKAALEVSEDDWSRVIDTNLSGCWRVAQAAARRMAETGGGSIVNIASVLGLRSAATVPAYAAAKAGLIHLTRVLALEWARHSIRVNALAPGYVITDLNRDFLASEAGKRLVARVPQRRFAELADLDGPLLLLASEASAHMTGSVVVVDGGHNCSTI